MLIRRRFSLLVVLCALAATGLGPVTAARAADPVVHDGTVVVVVTGGSGIPLPGMAVSLTASANGSPFQALDGLTDDDGRAVFGGVGRSNGGPAETITAAVARTSHELVDGCTFSQHWSGSARSAGAAGTVELAVTAGLATSIACAPPAPDAPILTGLVRDAGGAPVALATAWLAMERADGGRWVRSIGPSANGTFAVRIQPWGTEDEPARLELLVIGVASRQRTAGECTYTDGPLGSLVLDVILGEGLDPDPVTITTAVGQQSAVCGAVATPAPSDSTRGSGAAAETGPTITLPPTDAAAAIRGGSDAPLLHALVVALGLLALLVGWELARRDA